MGEIVGVTAVVATGFVELALQVGLVGTNSGTNRTTMVEADSVWAHVDHVEGAVVEAAVPAGHVETDRTTMAEADSA